MRGQALSNTRKLNKHWQSGEGGGHYVDPYVATVRIPALEGGVPMYFGDFYVPLLSNDKCGIISLYKKDNPSFISSGFFFGINGESLAALPINDGTNIHCTSIHNAAEYNEERQDWDYFVRAELLANSWTYRETNWPETQAYDFRFYPTDIIVRLRVLPEGDLTNMDIVKRESITLSDFYNASERYDTKTGTFNASILTAKYLQITLIARTSGGSNSLIIPIPSVLANAQEIIRTSGVALPVGSHDVSETHNPPIWRQESAFLRMTLIDDTHISVTVFSVYDIAIGFAQRFNVIIDVWEEDSYS